MHIYRTGPQTERLEHRAIIPDDADAFFALNSHPEVMRFTGEARLESLDQAREVIVNYEDFDTVGFGRWGCILKASGSLIGFCGLIDLRDLDAVDVGFRFLPEYWGQGLASAASVAFGFDILRLERIIALVLPQNVASIRVLEKCGMQADGSIIDEDNWRGS